MKMKMMQKAGALNDAWCDDSDEECIDDDYVSMHESVAELPVFSPNNNVVAETINQSVANYAQMHDSEDSIPVFKPRVPVENMVEERSPLMFYFVIAEGERFLVTDKQGRTKVEEGPKKIWKRGKKFVRCQRHLAHPGEFLMIRYLDGTQKHLPGPIGEWFNPKEHAQIQCEEALRIDAKEAIVVYSKNDEGNVDRRIVRGPAMFVPQPGEWLHKFAWHGTKGNSSRKVPGGLVFQKLWLMPDQMYHDVEDVRTADDVVLTIRLMIFFEMTDLEKMLEATHDPIGDFINATSSDVIDFVSRYTFDEFKQNSEKLNQLENYRQLVSRAQQVGYEINKIVYRGYATSQALERMHEQAIEKRTSLKLDKETEEQAQDLADFKQAREFERSSQKLTQDKEQEKFEIEKARNRHQEEIQRLKERSVLKQEQNKQQDTIVLENQINTDQQRLQFLAQLKEMGVDLNQYLTQGKADQVIEIRGDDRQAHLHLDYKNSDC